MNKFSFWLWSINGILIFGVLATLIYNRPFWLFEKQQDLASNPYYYSMPVSWGSIMVDKSKIDEKVFADYEAVLAVTGTQDNAGYRLASLVNMDIKQMSSGANQYFATTGLANLLFADSTGKHLGKLLDKTAYIHLVDLSASNIYDNITGQYLKPTKNYILYKISFEDTNQDGFLNEMDMAGLYISDIDGQNLKKLSPENSFCINYEFVDSLHERLRISYLEKSVRGKINEKEQQFLEYNVVSQTSKPAEDLNKVMKSIYQNSISSINIK